VVRKLQMLKENQVGTMFKKEWIKASDYPENFVPNQARIFVGVDMGSSDGDYTVKGFYDPATGEFHIQECGANALAQRTGAEGDRSGAATGSAAGDSEKEKT